MEDKMLRIDSKLHKQVKLAAILSGKTIRSWTEQVLAAALPERAQMLVDTKAEYSTKADPHV